MQHLDDLNDFDVTYFLTKNMSRAEMQDWLYKNKPEEIKKFFEIEKGIENG